MNDEILKQLEAMRESSDYSPPSERALALARSAVEEASEIGLALHHADADREGSITLYVFGGEEMPNGMYRRHVSIVAHTDEDTLAFILKSDLKFVDVFGWIPDAMLVISAFVRARDKILPEELLRLEYSKSEDEWNDICRDIKRPRDGKFPSDWQVKVMASGTMNRAMDRFKKGQA